MGGTTALPSLLNAPQPVGTVTLDKSTLQPVSASGGASSGPVTLDKSTLKPINDPSYAGNAFPELKNDPLSRTLYNMTAAQSGQKLATPEDEAEGEKGKAAGFKAAAVDAGLMVGGELLLAPRAVQVLSKVPAGRDPLTGQMLPWVVKTATEEGPSLARAGVQAIKAAGEAHPLVKQLIISGLGALGAGKIAHALGWIGNAIE
jgi:hypothetical protein